MKRTIAIKLSFIVSEARETGCGAIVLEDLKNIRGRIKAKKRERTRLHRWAFNELRMFVEYKAEAFGRELFTFSR